MSCQRVCRERLEAQERERLAIIIMMVSVWFFVSYCSSMSRFKILSPNGRSNVFDGVRTTGSEERGFEPRRKPVAEVSASDMIPGSSSISELLWESIGIIHFSSPGWWLVVGGWWSVTTRRFSTNQCRRHDLKVHQHQARLIKIFQANHNNKNG